MKKLIEIGNEYAEHSDWTDFALVKCCLCAAGIILGCTIPEKKRAPAIVIALMVFAVTYVPLILRVFNVFREPTEE